MEFSLFDVRSSIQQLWCAVHCCWLQRRLPLWNNAQQVTVCFEINLLTLLQHKRNINKQIMKWKSCSKFTPKFGWESSSTLAGKRPSYSTVRGSYSPPADDPQIPNAHSILLRYSVLSARQNIPQGTSPTFSMQCVAIFKSDLSVSCSENWVASWWPWETQNTRPESFGLQRGIWKLRTDVWHPTDFEREQFIVH